MIIAPPKKHPLKMANRGWHSRGYLPHFDSDSEIQSLDFRLFDSVPRHLYRTVGPQFVPLITAMLILTFLRARRARSQDGLAQANHLSEVPFSDIMPST